MIDLSPLFGNPADSPHETVTFRVFPRTSSARWLLEARFSSPWHLKTWPRANLRARIILWSAWMLSRIGIHLPSRLESFTVAQTSTYAKLRSEFDHIGIFLGTPGPNRKFVVYAESPGRSVFIKIPIAPASAALVRNETEALTALASVPALATMIPASSIVAGHLALEDIETQGVRYGELSLREIVRFCDLLEARSPFTRSLNALRADWEQAPLGALARHDFATSAQIAAARNAALCYLDSLPEHLPVACYDAHGDFTLWNVLRAADGAARVIDWEMFGPKPVRFDLIHYFVSQDLLVKNKSPDKVLSHLAHIGNILGEKSGWLLSQGLYFAVQSLYYCGIYERQQTLHPQALTQLRAWARILKTLSNSDAKKATVPATRSGS